jgi:putative transposase
MRLCIVGLSSDAYYNYDKRRKIKEERDGVRSKRIKEVSKKGKGKLGIMGIKIEYDKKYEAIDGCINKKAVKRLMKESDIVCTIRRKKKVKPEVPKKEENPRIAPNLVNREFGIPSPFFILGTDTTQILSYVLNKFFYIAAIRDYGTHEYIGWSISLHNNQELVDNCVKDAIERNGRDMWKDIIYHTDRGATYTSSGHWGLITSLGAERSMSRKGNCHDNAPIESGWSTMKDWLDLSQCTKLEEAKILLDEYMHFYNNERLQWGLKKMTPVEYRNHLLVNEI